MFFVFFCYSAFPRVFQARGRLRAGICPCAGGAVDASCDGGASWRDPTTCFCCNDTVGGRRDSVALSPSFVYRPRKNAVPSCVRVGYRLLAGPLSGPRFVCRRPDRDGRLLGLFGRFSHLLRVAQARREFKPAHDSYFSQFSVSCSYHRTAPRLASQGRTASRHRVPDRRRRLSAPGGGENPRRALAVRAFVAQWLSRHAGRASSASGVSRPPFLACVAPVIPGH